MTNEVAEIDDWVWLPVVNPDSGYVRQSGPAAAALLVVAGVCRAVLVVPVLRHWKTPTAGISFVLTVATEGLAVLGATLAVSYRAGWLVIAAAAALVLGLAFYVFTAARFDLRDMVTGHGDHWVAGGAFAGWLLALAGLFRHGWPVVRGRRRQAADPDRM